MAQITKQILFAVPKTGMELHKNNWFSLLLLATL